MANKDILEYLRETPRNTNVNVVKGMIGNSGSSSIEMTTLFDDDLIGFSYTPSSQYGPATARLEGTIIPTSTVGSGFLKITYEGISKFIILNGGYSVSFSIDSNLPVSLFSISSYYDPVDSVIINIYGRDGQDVEFETYCQTPHHLKIEWFTIQ